MLKYGIGLEKGIDIGQCILRFLFPDEGRLAMVLVWLNDYPIVSIEDALAEDDWEYWPLLRSRVKGRALVVGDDLLVTNPGRIGRAINTEAADTLLLKVNQVGTLSEALDARALAVEAGWMITISARSGETEDTWLADLGVGWSCDQIKVGSMARSERLAKWNRLLAIERETSLPMVAWPGKLAVSALSTATRPTSCDWSADSGSAMMTLFAACPLGSLTR